MNVTTIGIDLAKNTFSLCGSNVHGKVLFRKTLQRDKLLAFIAQQPPCLIGMEACSGAHYWARQFQSLGHTIGIMAPKFVTPFRKGGKNDSNDAAAIAQAVAHPEMHFVTVKSAEQQAALCLHRLREGLVADRTAQVNRLRGLLSEFGIVIPQGFGEAKRTIPAILDDTNNALPVLARRLLRDAYDHLEHIHQQVLAYDREIESIARLNEDAKRLTAIPGIGPITATALLATVGDFKQFKNGRQFAAWLGLTPRQYTTGGKTRLGRITKRGDVYLRTLLIHGARSVVARREQKLDAVGHWIKALVNRAGFKCAAVALAAKQARMVWAIMTKQSEYTAVM
jgi:transposase